MTISVRFGMTWERARSSFLGETIVFSIAALCPANDQVLYSCLFSLQAPFTDVCKDVEMSSLHGTSKAFFRQRRNIAHIQYNPFINDLCAYANTSFLEQLARSVSWGWAFVRIRTLIPLWVLERKKQSIQSWTKLWWPMNPNETFWVCILIVFERSLKLGNISNIYYIFSLIC